jgi:hypothetical protein
MAIMRRYGASEGFRSNFAVRILFWMGASDFSGAGAHRVSKWPTKRCGTTETFVKDVCDAADSDVRVEWGLVGKNDCARNR